MNEQQSLRSSAPELTLRSMHPIAAIAKRLKAFPTLAEAIATSGGAHALVFYAAAKRLLKEAAGISASSHS